VIISFIGWAGLARVLRGQVLSINKREYVQAAVLIGAPNWKIILREIIPQLSTYLIIAATLSFPSYILAETTLSFLGLGISQPDSSLGNILAEGRKLSNLFLYPWMALGPTFVIVLLTWACNSLGDSLRDAFDVKS
jgi:peptide/nickel transport system permease protein